MPRDFVPCVYTDRQLYNHVTDTDHRRVQVIECFEGTQWSTGDRLVLLGLDSHAYFLDTDPDDDRACEHLFDIFYAAMAALE